MANRKYDYDAIEKMHLRGLTTKEIGDNIGTSYQVIHGILSKKGYTFTNQKYDHEIIKKYIIEGKHESDIIKLTGLKQGTVHWIVKKYFPDYKRKDISGDNNPKWRGGIIYDRGRKLIYSPDHPLPDALKMYCYEYRLIMEEHIGRYLNKKEIVHHINRDHTDNRIENLQIVNRVEHMKIHRQDLIRGVKNKKQTIQN